MTFTTYIDFLELPAIEHVSVQAVKEWAGRMQQLDVVIDFRTQTANDFHPDIPDMEIDPDSEFTFDQTGFIDGQLRLAKDICKKCGYSFTRALNYLTPPEGVYLEVYPMINIDDSNATLCTREHNRNPDFYDVLIRGETLEEIYYEKEDIHPRNINKLIHAACKRFNCSYETVSV